MYRNDFQGVIDLRNQLSLKISNIPFEYYQADNLKTKAEVSIDLYSDVNKLQDPELKDNLNSILNRMQNIENNVIESSTSSRIINREKRYIQMDINESANIEEVYRLTKESR